MRSVLLLLLSASLAFGAAGCGDEQDSFSSEVSAVAEVPDRDVVAAWPEKWCSVQPGVTRDELVAAMGEPTSEHPESASWDAFGYQFNAFFTEDGTVSQLDINMLGLTEAQKAKIQCEDTRVG